MLITFSLFKYISCYHFTSTAKIEYLMTLELISIIPLVGPPDTDPLAVKLLDNQLYMSPISHMKKGYLFTLLYSRTGPAEGAAFYIQ